MTYENLDIRIKVMESGLTYRTIAEHLGISCEWMSRLMRFPLSEYNQKRILSAIKEILNERKHTQNRNTEDYWVRK